MKLLYLFFLLFLFLQLSCKDNSTNPPSNNNPPGYQEDIPWPSLADSPWPMYRGDPQGTGRSDLSTIISGNIQWTIDTLRMLTNCSIDKDTIIYAGVQSTINNDISGLAAINRNGEIIWLFKFPLYNIETISSPLVTSQGIIYISSPEEKLYAVSKSGIKNWEVETGGLIIQNGINIDKKGNIYALVFKSAGFNLLCIGKEGTIKWEIINDGFAGEPLNGMSFSPDGSTLYIPGKLESPSVYAFDIENQTIKWSFGEGRLDYSGQPLIDSYGNIYLISKNNDQGSLFSINSSGEVRWIFDLGIYSLVQSTYTPFTIDKNGNIYAGKYELISLDYLGQLRWKYKPDNEFLDISSPLITIGNNIYFTSYIEAGKELYCINSDGKLMWKINVPDNFFRTFSPSAGYNSLYLSTFHDKIIRSIR